jgi:hypothetical protein
MHLNYKSGYWTPVHEQKQSYMRLPYILFTKTLRDQWKDVVSYLELAQKCISKWHVLWLVIKKTTLQEYTLYNWNCICKSQQSDYIIQKM